MTVIELNKKLFSFPEKWNELTPQQAQKIFAVLHSNYTDDQMLLQFIRILSGCSWWCFFRSSAAEKAEVFHLCSFIWEKTELTTQMLVKYKGLTGPVSDWDNLRMGEFAYAQNFFEQYRDNEDIEALNKLCAVLYRPQKKNYNKIFNPDEDLRIQFSESSMHWHVKNRVARWPRHIKELIFFWYGSCFKKLMDDNAEIFTGDGGEPAQHGIVSIMRNVAKDGTFGDFDKVQQLFVKLFFIELKESKHEAAQMKKP